MAHGTRACKHGWRQFMAVSKLSVNYGTPAQFNAGTSVINSLNPATFQQLVANSSPAFGYQLGALSATAIYANVAEATSTQITNISTNTVVASAVVANYVQVDGNLVAPLYSRVDSLTSVNTVAQQVSAQKFYGDFYTVKNKGYRGKHYTYNGIFNPSIAFYQSTCQEGSRCGPYYWCVGRLTLTTSASCVGIEGYTFVSNDNRRNCITRHNANLVTLYMGYSTTLHTLNAGDNATTGCLYLNPEIQLQSTYWKNQQPYMYDCNGYYRNKIASMLPWSITATPNTTYSIYPIIYPGGYASQWNYLDKTFISAKELVSL